MPAASVDSGGGAAKPAIMPSSARLAPLGGAGAADSRRVGLVIGLQYLGGGIVFL